LDIARQLGIDGRRVGSIISNSLIYAYVERKPSSDLTRGKVYDYRRKR